MFSGNVFFQLAFPSTYCTKYLASSIVSALDIWFFEWLQKKAPCLPITLFCVFSSVSIYFIVLGFFFMKEIYIAVLEVH